MPIHRKLTKHEHAKAVMATAQAAKREQKAHDEHKAGLEAEAKAKKTTVHAVLQEREKAAIAKNKTAHEEKQRAAQKKG